MRAKAGIFAVSLNSQKGNARNKVQGLQLLKHEGNPRAEGGFSVTMLQDYGISVTFRSILPKLKSWGGEGSFINFSL